MSSIPSFLGFLILTFLATSVTSQVLTEEKSEVELYLSSENDTLEVTIPNATNYSWKFSLFLDSFECANSVNYTIVVFNKVSNETKNWDCSSLKSHGNSHRHSQGNSDVNGNRFFADLENVKISLIPESQEQTTNVLSNETVKATIVASMYFEWGSSSCPKNYFNCHANRVTCPSPNSNMHQGINNPIRSLPVRCISFDNVCNNKPSCGYHFNADEADEVCHTEEFCQFIPDWAFIITRSLVAVIFVLIPTVVVFLLFQRRQVALQRARLMRDRMAEESRRNFSVAIIEMQNKYANDFPPTYDDLYDTKDPPPCFCVVQATSSPSDTPTLPSTEAPDTIRDSEEPRNPHVTSYQNPSFECTCKTTSN